MCYSDDVCENSTCLNGGTCVRRATDYECSCQSDYSGSMCESKYTQFD